MRLLVDDEAVLARAVADKRVVVTFDVDFADIAASAGQARAAVILLRLRSARTTRILDRLPDVLASTAQALETGAIVIVEETRLRIRRLPIGR
jgi:predicted nuclease of predicted toxin-antitoxin system